MLALLRSWWSPPTFPTSAAGDQALLTFLLARLLMTLTFVAAPLLLLIDAREGAHLAAISLTWSIGFWLIIALVRRGRWLLATWAIPSMVLLGVTLLTPVRDVSFDVIGCGVMLATVIATLLLKRSGAAVFGGLGIA